MKKCPFCSEEIQDEAIKCKHCGEFLDEVSHLTMSKKRFPWYFRTPFIIIAVCRVGSLALPLIWWRPQTTWAWKIGLTVGILVLSWLLFQASLKSIDTLKQYYDLMNEF